MSWDTTILMSPTIPSSGFPEFLPISSAEMSTWINWAAGFHFGASPKWRIQLRRAPSISTTSASLSAVLRALAVLAGWESATTPLPIGVGRNGRFVLSMRSLITPSALA